MNTFQFKNVNIIQKLKCPWKCERLIQIDSIHEIKCNDCDKNNHIGCDSETKQKLTTRLKDQAHFTTNQKEKSTIFSKHFCESVHHYFRNKFT